MNFPDEAVHTSFDEIARGIDEITISANTAMVFHITRQPELYSIYWPSAIPPIQFAKVVRSLEAVSDREDCSVWLGTSDEPAVVPIWYLLEKLASVVNAARLLRIETTHTAYIWEREFGDDFREETSLVGLVSRKADIEEITSLYRGSSLSRADIPDAVARQIGRRLAPYSDN